MAKVEQILVTPKIAEVLLGGNINNRKVRDKHVDALARAMKNGDWFNNGETICVSKSGVLVDGQHRLLAVIKSGASVPMTIISEIEDEQAKNYDSNITRSTSDYLTICGYSKNQSSTFTVSMIRNIHRVLKGADAKLTNTEIENFINHNTELVGTTHKIAFGTHFGTHNPMSVNPKGATVATAIFFAICNGVPEDVLNRFASVLAKGVTYEKSESAALMYIRTHKAIWEAHSRNTVVLTHICERAIYDFAHQIERGKAYGESVGARGIYSKSLTWDSLYNGELSL